MMKRCYLFAYFYGNGEDGMHLAYSHDGLEWVVLAGGNRSFSVPEVGEKLMRDPFVMVGPDGMFRAAWTTSWHERGIGICSSPDLINWGRQRFLPVMEHEPLATNSWAPEMVYDAEKKQYIIFWSTTIPGRFPDTDFQDNTGEPGKGMNNRIYCVTTKDFETFSQTKLFYDPGINVIDACIRPDGKRYVMFVKDETNMPFVPQKNIMVAFADHAEGPYTKPSAPITGNFWAEGPSGIKIEDTWYVYFDAYRQRRYGVVISKDLSSWTDISERLRLPKNARHGTVLEVPRPVLEKLLTL
jgi:beta-xylosidase